MKEHAFIEVGKQLNRVRHLVDRCHRCHEIDHDMNASCRFGIHRLGAGRSEVLSKAGSVRDGVEQETEVKRGERFFTLTLTLYVCVPGIVETSSLCAAVMRPKGREIAQSSGSALHLARSGERMC